MSKISRPHPQGGQHAPPIGDSTLHHLCPWDFSIALQQAGEQYGIDAGDEYVYRGMGNRDRWPELFDLMDEVTQRTGRRLNTGGKVVSKNFLKRAVAPKDLHIFRPRFNQDFEK